MILAQNFSTSHSGRTSQFSIGLARTWEKLGDPQRALAAAMRLSVWETEVMPYLAAQIRETARLAVLAGDKKRARRSYSHYIRMRAEAEPWARARIDSTRRELARLGS